MPTKKVRAIAREISLLIDEYIDFDLLVTVDNGKVSDLLLKILTQAASKVGYPSYMNASLYNEKWARNILINKVKNMIEMFLPNMDLTIDLSSISNDITIDQNLLRYILTPQITNHYNYCSEQERRSINNRIKNWTTRMVYTIKKKMNDLKHAYYENLLRYAAYSIFNRYLDELDTSYNIEEIEYNTIYLVHPTDNKNEESYLSDSINESFNGAMESLVVTSIDYDYPIDYCIDVCCLSNPIRINRLNEISFDKIRGDLYVQHLLTSDYMMILPYKTNEHIMFNLNENYHIDDCTVTVDIVKSNNIMYTITPMEVAPNATF